MSTARGYSLVRKLLGHRGERLMARWSGNLRERERLGLLRRPHYAYGLLRAADTARYFGHQEMVACEFGVASGAGLVNLTELAQLIGHEAGVKIRVVGFDTGEGLPAPKGFKDHPEIWSSGDFAMTDRGVLQRKLDGRAEIIFGDIENTVEGFSDSLVPTCPLGFIAIDVDIYTATKSALRCLSDDTAKLLPAISMYFDDVRFFFANEWCGELCAIREFNEDHESRKIGLDRSLPGSRARDRNWFTSMYVCHVLDHPARQRPVHRESLDLKEHLELMRSYFS